MRYAKIRKTDISNGDGIRTSLFVQGCSFHCVGCFNTDTWDFNGGKPWNNQLKKKFIELGEEKFINGYSILGGEPFEQDIQLLKLIREIKDCSKKSIWMWTGFTWEELTSNSNSRINFNLDILEKIDVLVDGQYEENKSDMNCEWTGSTNQRVIDVQKSLKKKKIVLVAK